MNHLNLVIGNLAEDPRGFYRFIKNNCTDSNGIPSLKTSSGIILADEEKAKCLNDYFVSVFTKEDENTIPSIEIHPDMPSFEVTKNGVVKLLSGLDPKKSLGPDDISPRILRETCVESADVLTYIFNQSLASGIVPADWRVANIFALHKKGAKELPENYRPISLTSICSKLLEHIVYSSISQFLSDNHIISPRQHGFRPGHSCETQLILSVDDWSKSLDRGLRTDMAIFDFSKAFDSVPHQRLIVKLISYGIRGNTLAWISSFLMNREQRVTINGSKSSWLPVTSGVPQGTVLGPLLFLLCINDIASNVHSEIRLFADDCILYRTINKPTDCLILQDDINQLLSWASIWQMQFNSKKCHILSITRQKSRPTATYTLGVETLSRVDSYPNYLGVTLSSDLRWHNHISNNSTKTSRTLNFVRRNVYSCSPEAKALAYTSLVRPHLEYAASAWDPYLSMDNCSIGKCSASAACCSLRMQRLQTYHIGYWSPGASQLTLPVRRTNSRLVTFYTAVNNQIAIPTNHLQKPPRYTRNSDETTFTSLSSRQNPRK